EARRRGRRQDLPRHRPRHPGPDDLPGRGQGDRPARDTQRRVRALTRPVPGDTGGPMRRFSIAELLGIIAVVAIGLAAMRDASPLVFSAVFTITLVALLVALLGAWVGTRPRGAWCGFAVFGWANFLIAFVPALESSIGADLPTTGLFQDIGSRFHRPP